MPYTITSKHSRAEREGAPMGDPQESSGVINVSDANVTSNTPIEFVGNFFPDYAPKIAESFLDIMENFSDDTAPYGFREGMIWYKRNDKDMRFYNGADWISFNTAANSAGTLFPRLDTANNINLRLRTPIANSIRIFEHPIRDVANDTGIKYHATVLLLKVNNLTGINDTDATIGLHKFSVASDYVPTADDILSSNNVNATSGSQHINFFIQGATQTISAGEEIRLEIKTASTSNSTPNAFTVDAYLFGYVS